MGPVITIVDPADDRIGDYRNLTDAVLRQREEAAAGMFLAEGTLVIRQLLVSAYPIRSFLLTRIKFDDLAPDLEAADPAAPVYLVETSVMQGITGFAFHRGALASVQRLTPADPCALVAPPARLVVVAEGVNDHENLGGLFRNAGAFGLDAVLLNRTCADPLYRRSVRVSMGQVLRIPWAWLDSWPAALEDIRAAGFTIVALTPDPDAPTLDQALACLGGSAGRSGAVAVLVGAEGPGLSAPARHAADVSARIPMAPGVDSLNVATAAAIAFHRLSVARDSAQWR